MTDTILADQATPEADGGADGAATADTPKQDASSDAPKGEPKPEAGDKPADGEGETEGEEDKSGEGEKQEGDEPAEYGEFSMPDGFELDEAALKEAKPVFKELGLNQEQAQKLVDLYAAQQAKAMGSLAEQSEAVREEWQGSIKEEWGSDFDKNVSVASKALDRFGGQALRDALNETGAGDHPAIIKFFHQIGKTISEDAMDGKSKGSAPPPRTLEERAQAFYPSMKPKEG